MKVEKIEGQGDPRAGRKPVARGAPRSRNQLSEDIIHMMEQGVVAWSAQGQCELHNGRIYEMLELGLDQLKIGMSRRDFLDFAVKRGEFEEAARKRHDARYAAGQPFSFDRRLPSGRVVSTNARPTREGGYVETFTDVTEARRQAKELAQAKQDAESAEARAKQILLSERARQSEAKMLGRLDEWLQSCKSLEELYMIVRQFMGRLLPHSEGELYVYSKGRESLEGVCEWGSDIMHEEIAPDACWALRRGRSYEYAEGGLCFACDHVQDQSDKAPPPKEYICVPIIAHGDTVGLLHIRFKPDEEGAAQIERSGAFAVRCGEHISMAVANVRLRDELHERSIRDPLTGLHNRRYFMDMIRKLISKGQVDNTPFGLISFDADKFKNFNDNHGHDAGDMVLKAIAEASVATMSKGDGVFRMGGEEFAILLPGADHDQTMAQAEKLREAVAAIEIDYGSETLPPITISAGVSVFPDGGSSPQGLLKRSDRALYTAKEAGRNCVRTGHSDTQLW